MNEHIVEYFVNGDNHGRNMSWEIWIKKMDNVYPKYLQEYG